MKLTLPSFVQEILTRFDSEGFQIYIVGGAVRDILTERSVDDWDFTTNATPFEILKIFPDAFYDNQFGTVGISRPDSPNPYEITTFRREIGYTDSRHPDKIEWGTKLEEDLARRDFTINAMALKATSNKAEVTRKGDLSLVTCHCELIDPYEGQKDLEARIIRAVGDPNERFSEDALRMMRAVRIATELGFTIEAETWQALKLNSAQIEKISKERISEELLKILSSDFPYEGILILRNSSLLGFILPELERCFGVAQKSPQRHHLWDVGTHSLLSLKYCKSLDPITRLATLLHDIGKAPTFKKNPKTGIITFYNHEVVGASLVSRICQRLKFSKKQKDKLVTLVRWHQFTVDERQTDSAIRRFIRNAGRENLEEILSLRVADRLGGGARETSWRLEEFKARLVEVQKQPFTVADLKIDGNDVMKIVGIEPGPLVGKILLQLFEEVVENKIANKKEPLLTRLDEIQNDLKNP